MKALKFGFIFSFLTLLAMVFVNCSKVEEEVPAGINSLSAWNPPQGALVAGGITMGDAWGPAYYLASPINLTTNGGWTDSVTVSRDGASLYFAYSKRDGEQYLYNNGNVVVNGPARTSDNTSIYLQIFKADIGPNGYTISLSGANPSNAVDVAAEAVNSAQDLMAYTVYPSGSPQQIKLAQLTNGTWSQLGAMAAPVNGPAGNCKDDNPFLIGNIASGTIYWQSLRNDLPGTDCSNQNHLIHIYSAIVTNGSMSSAQQVPGLYTATSKDYEASFSEDKSKAYWTRVDAPNFGIYTADWNGASYANVRPIVSINNFSAPYDNRIVDVGEANVVELAQGSILYFRCVVALSTTSGNPSGRQLRICFSKKAK